MVWIGETIPHGVANRTLSQNKLQTVLTQEQGSVAYYILNEKSEYLCNYFLFENYIIHVRVYLLEYQQCRRHPFCFINVEETAGENES